MYTRNRGGRRGYVMVLALLAGAALVGVAAVTVDLGMLCVSQEHAQATVDAAALSGAHHLPSSSDSSQWAQECIQANNSGSSLYQLSIPSTDGITYYAPREDVPGYGAIGPDMHAVRVRATGTVDYTFARILGTQQGQVDASAIAIQKDRRGWGGIFVKYEADLRDAHVEITGPIHSNNHIAFGTSDGFVDGDVSFSNWLSYSYAMDFLGGKYGCAQRSRPTNCVDSDFVVDYDLFVGDSPQLTGAVCSGYDIIAKGASTVDFPPGVYECDDLILRNCGTITGDRVTFLVRDEVEIYNNDAIALSANQHDITIYVTGTDTYAVTMEQGGLVDITGGICVPDGGLYLNTSDLQVTDGLVFSKNLYIDQTGTIVNRRSDTRVSRLVELVR